MSYLRSSSVLSISYSFLNSSWNYLNHSVNVLIIRRRIYIVKVMSEKSKIFLLVFICYFCINIDGNDVSIFSLKQSLRSWKKLKFLRMKLIMKSNIDKIGFCDIISEISPLNYNHTLTHLCYEPLFYEHLWMKNE